MSQDSRNYYDDQFNDRINQIAKPGATPPSGGSGSSGGGGWSLKGGLGGGAVLVFIVIRLVLAAGRLGSSSSTPTYYTPPTYQPPPITIPEHQFDPKPIENEKLREEFRKIREKQQQDLREPARDQELPPWKGERPANPPLGGPKGTVPPGLKKE
jgi:hypothetical protein